MRGNKPSKIFISLILIILLFERNIAIKSKIREKTISKNKGPFLLPGGEISLRPDGTILCMIFSLIGFPCPGGDDEGGDDGEEEEGDGGGGEEEGGEEEEEEEGEEEGGEESGNEDRREKGKGIEKAKKNEKSNDKDKGKGKGKGKGEGEGEEEGEEELKGNPLVPSARPKLGKWPPAFLKPPGIVKKKRKLKKGEFPPFNTPDFWKMYGNPKNRPKMNKGPEKLCPQGYMPILGGASPAGQAPTVELKRKLDGSDAGKFLYIGNILIGGDLLPLVIDTGHAITWALSIAWFDKGSMKIVKRMGFSGPKRMPTMFGMIDVMIDEGKPAKPGTGGAVSGPSFTDTGIIGGPKGLLFGVPFVMGVDAKWVYPSMWNSTGRFGLGHAVDFPTGVKFFTLWQSMKLEYLKMVLESLPKLPKWIVPKEQFVFYHGEKGGCFVFGTVAEGRFHKGPISWFPTFDGITSWMFRIRDILVEDKSIGLCPGGCLAALHTGTGYIHTPKREGIKLMMATSANPTCTNMETLPTVSIVLTNGKRVVFQGNEYSKKYEGPSGDTFCNSIFVTQPPGAFPGKVWILGTTFMMKQTVFFDGEGKKVGLADTEHSHFIQKRCLPDSTQKLARCVKLPKAKGKGGGKSKPSTKIPKKPEEMQIEGEMGKECPDYAPFVQLRCKHMGFDSTRRMALYALKKYDCDIDEATYYIATRPQEVKDMLRKIDEAKEKYKKSLIPVVIARLKKDDYECTEKMAERALDIKKNNVKKAVKHLKMRGKEVKAELKALNRKEDPNLVDLVKAGMAQLIIPCTTEMAKWGLKVKENNVKEALIYLSRNHKRIARELRDRDWDKYRVPVEKNLIDYLKQRMLPLGYEIDDKFATEALRASSNSVEEAIHFILKNYKLIKSTIHKIEESERLRSVLPMLVGDLDNDERIGELQRFMEEHNIKEDKKAPFIALIRAQGDVSTAAKMLENKYRHIKNESEVWSKLEEKLFMPSLIHDVSFGVKEVTFTEPSEEMVLRALKQTHNDVHQAIELIITEISKSSDIDRYVSAKFSINALKVMEGDAKTIYETAKDLYDDKD